MKASFRVSSMIAIILISVLACNDRPAKPGQDDTSDTIPGSGNSEVQLQNPPGTGNYLVDPVTARKWIDNYLQEPGVNPERDRTRIVSKAVWFSKAMLADLVRQIESDPAIDGIRFYMAEYDQFVHGSYQESPYQTTLVLVATDNTHANHFDRFDYFSKALKSRPALLDAANHGELCPQKCYPPQ